MGSGMSIQDLTPIVLTPIVLANPGDIGTGPFPGDGSAVTNPITKKVTVDDFYLRELTDIQRLDLLETIIHESIHRTNPRSDMLRRPFKHPDIYDEAERWRKELEGKMCY